MTFVASLSPVFNGLVNQRPVNRDFYPEYSRALVQPKRFSKMERSFAVPDEMNSIKFPEIPKHLRSLFADIANSLIPNFDFSDNLEDTINWMGRVETIG